MARWFDPQRMAPLATVLLAVLLVALAFLQHTWIAEVSVAERQRMKEGLTAAAERLASELHHEIGRVFLSFQPESEWDSRRARVVQQARTWYSTAPFPDLIQDTFVAERVEGGAVELERLDLKTSQFVPARWPADLAPLRTRLARGGAPVEPSVDAVKSAAPVLVLPLIWPRPGEGPPMDHGAVVLRLDREFLGKVLIPELVKSWFGRAEADLLVAVMAPDGPVYLSDPSLPVSRYLPGDVSMLLLGLQPMSEDLGREHHGHRRSPLPSAAGEAQPAARSVLPWRYRHRWPGPPLILDNQWRLVVTHRAGSLEAAVARARHHNMAVSAGVLVLLAASLAVMAMAGQRAHRLARQQMELIAGVTHELNTPLAAIRSAGQNLADGIVADPAQARRYGTLIEREGSRLSSLVAKALELAGIQSGSKVYRPEPVPLAEVVDEVLAGSRWALEESRFEVDKELPDDLPPALADRGALRLAIQNLVDNAVKYAADGRWIGLRARAMAGGRWVTLTVEDRGPGIRPEDRPKLFEPFYRGRQEGATPIPGSGLGLSLVRQVVEAQGGRVSVGPGSGGQGSAFELRLPAARREEREEAS